MARKMNIPVEQPITNVAEIPAIQQETGNTKQGEGIPPKASEVESAVTDTSPSVPSSSYKPQEETNNGGTPKWMIVAFAALLVGSGLWYLGREKKADAPTMQVSTASTPVAITPPASSPTPKPSTQNNLKEAEMELQQYGINYHIDATSYGHNSDGFLALDNKNGVLLIVDRKNHQTAEVWPKNMSFKQLCQQKKTSSPSPIIVEFRIPNAVKDSDAPYGKWAGNMHIFPIYCSYIFDSAGNIVPGMLTSGKGENPSHYQGPLYEQRSVDLANLFLMEAIPFWKDCERRGR